MGGEYGLRNYTIKHLQSLKGKAVLTETMPFTPNEAAAAEEAGIDTLRSSLIQRILPARLQFVKRLLPRL